MKHKNLVSNTSKIISLLSLFLFVFQTPTNANAASADNTPQDITLSNTGEYIIKMRENVSALSAKTVAAERGAALVSENNQHILMKLDKGTEKKTLERLASDPNVEYIEPNIKMRSLAEVEDPEYSQQWGLREIQAEEAWNEAASTSEVTVAVIDTGVDYTHPDLSNRVDTKNDIDYINGDSDAMDDNGHGTHVAGIIAAELNGVGIAGVAGVANVTILPLKVLDENGDGDLYDVAMAIMDAADLGADVINMSLGGYWDERIYGKPKTMIDAVQYATDKGAVVIASAGNESDDAENYIPASIPAVITVSAVDEDLEFADFSNYGSSLDLAAPGNEILSTWPGGGYEYASGTSMATPFVSGVAALLKAQRDELDGSELAGLLLDSATDLGKRGRDELYGYGLVNAYRALGNGAKDGAEPDKELEKITSSVNRLSLKPGGQSQLSITAYYADGSTEDVSSEVEWSSANRKVASVENGLVTANDLGQTYITARYGEKTVKVAVEIKLTRLEASRSKLFMKPDDSSPIKLRAVYGNDKQIVTGQAEWKSSNSKVAVYEDGNIVAKGFGRAAITAKYRGKSARISVDTTLKKLEADATRKTLKIDDTYSPVVKATYRDESKDIVTEGITWISSNEKIANVDDQGRISAKAEGRAAISAKYGGKTVRISITVEE